MTTPLPDATELATLVRSGQASPAELVDDAIARVERLDPTINAVIHERFEAARAEARAVLPDGPFRGVPFLVKDLGCEMAGEPHTLGNRVLKEAGVREHRTRTSMNRFVVRDSSRSGARTPPSSAARSPPNPRLSARAVTPGIPTTPPAARRAAPPLRSLQGWSRSRDASDGGGSIRVPASECGLVGLKPSRGRISQGPKTGEGWAGATTDGVVSRSVRDTAAMLDVMSGRHTGDPYVAVPPTRPFADEVGVDPGRLRIGLAPSHAGVQTDPECVAAVEATGSLLESLGHDVEVAQPDAFFDEEFSRHFVTIVAVATALDFVNMGQAIGRPIVEDDVEASNWVMGSIGQAVSGADYITSVNWVHAWSRRLQAWWDDFDVLVSPVIAVPPPPIGWLSDPELGTERLTSILQFTAQFNVSGQPAVSLPLHWSESDLPVGVQFGGPIDDEALLIRLAAQLETAAPWSERLPPLYG